MDLQDQLGLPLEVWEQIWSYLNFDTRQKICIQVSKKWFSGIRCSSKLSNELKIDRRLSNEQVNSTLANWPKLWILQWHWNGSYIDLSQIEHLKKMIGLKEIIIVFCFLDGDGLAKILMEFPAYQTLW